MPQRGWKGTYHHRSGIRSLRYQCGRFEGLLGRPRSRSIAGCQITLVPDVRHEVPEQCERLARPLQQVRKQLVSGEMEEGPADARTHALQLCEVLLATRRKGWMRALEQDVDFIFDSWLFDHYVGERAPAAKTGFAFHRFRHVTKELDSKGVSFIFVEGIDDRGGDLAAAVMNRMRKAAAISDQKVRRRTTSKIAHYVISFSAKGLTCLTFGAVDGGERCVMYDRLNGELLSR